MLCLADSLFTVVNVTGQGGRISEQSTLSWKCAVLTDRADLHGYLNTIENTENALCLESLLYCLSLESFLRDARFTCVLVPLISPRFFWISHCASNVVVFNPIQTSCLDQAAQV